jgi:hypothetical protein
MHSHKKNTKWRKPYININHYVAATSNGKRQLCHQSNSELKVHVYVTRNKIYYIWTITIQILRMIICWSVHNNDDDEKVEWLWWQILDGKTCQIIDDREIIHQWSWITRHSKEHKLNLEIIEWFLNKYLWEIQ